MSLLSVGRLGLELGLGIRVGFDVVLWHDGRFGGGLVPGYDGIRVVLFDRYL